MTSAIRHDSSRFRKLLIRITGELGDVYGDKAYSSRENAELAVERGGRPFLMPRNNASNRAKGQSMERNDELLGRASSGFQKQIPQTKQC